jgi:hypothetical protein
MNKINKIPPAIAPIIMAINSNKTFLFSPEFI